MGCCGPGAGKKGDTDAEKMGKVMLWSNVLVLAGTDNVSPLD